MVSEAQSWVAAAPRLAFGGVVAMVLALALALPMAAEAGSGGGKASGSKASKKSKSSKKRSKKCSKKRSTKSSKRARKSAKKRTRRCSKPSKRPVVISVRPRKARVGQKVLVLGDRFTKGAGKNVVFFKRGRQLIWLKGDGLDRQTIEVKLPTKIIHAMGASNGRLLTSAFKVRVKARYLGARFTRKVALRVSPPPAGDCDQDGLQDALEREVGTDICELDTDGDGLTDFFEYSAAKAWNGGVYPFPGLFPKKRPIPNPLKADTDGDEKPDGQEDTDTDALTATVEQDLSALTAQMPQCGDPLIGGLPNVFHNNLNRPLPYFNDGAEDSDGDGLVDGGDLPRNTKGLGDPGGTLPRAPYGGENLDCDGWVPRLEWVTPKAKVADKDAVETEPKKDDDADLHYLTFADQSLCAEDAPRPVEGMCKAHYSQAAIACRVAPPGLGELGNFVGLDNRAERTIMKGYGNMLDPDQDGDGIPDGCDDTDADGYPDALEAHMMRDQEWRKINFATGDEPSTEEGEWNPLDPCKPGPRLNNFKYSHSGCNPDPESTPAGPLG